MSFDIWHSLPFVKGWAWDLKYNPSPLATITLNRGVPVTLFDLHDEEGWIVLIYTIFSDPACFLRGQVDQYDTTEYETVNNLFLLTPLVPNNILLFCSVWNPAIPAYGIGFLPAYPMHYKQRVLVTCGLPAGSLAPTALCLVGSLGKIYVTNKKLFVQSLNAWFESIKAGKMIDPSLAPRAIPR